MRPRDERVEAAAPASDPSLLQRIEGLWNKHYNSEIECFDCKAKHEVSSAATSSFCPKCSTHVDLRNYKITTSFSRSIKTKSEIHITAKWSPSTHRYGASWCHGDRRLAPPSFRKTCSYMNQMSESPQSPVTMSVMGVSFSSRW